MISIQVDTTNPDTEREIAEAIEEMLGLLPVQTVVMTAPQPVNILCARCEDGAEYDLYFSVPADCDVDTAQGILNHEVSVMYDIADLYKRLEKHGILPVELRYTENVF